MILKILKPNMNTATRHWVGQRLSSVALIPLTFFTVFSLSAHFGMSHSDVMSLYNNPLRSFLVLLFLLTTTLHFKQGAEVVIEDYVHDEIARKLLLVFNTSLYWFLFLITIFAFARITFDEWWVNL